MERYRPQELRLHVVRTMQDDGDARLRQLLRAESVVSLVRAGPERAAAQLVTSAGLCSPIAPSPVAEQRPNIGISGRSPLLFDQLVGAGEQLVGHGNNGVEPSLVHLLRIGPPELNGTQRNHCVAPEGVGSVVPANLIARG